MSAIETLRDFLNNREDKIYGFTPEIEMPNYTKSTILSVFIDDDKLQMGVDMGGCLFIIDTICESMAEYLLENINDSV